MLNYKIVYHSFAINYFLSYMSNYSIRLAAIAREVQRKCLFSDVNFKLVSILCGNSKR